MLLAAIAVAAATAGPAAVAAPLSPALTSGQAQQGSGGSAGKGSPPGTVSWSVLPATANGPDLNRNIFTYGVLKPGSTVTDHVMIVNRGKGGAVFSIYATDAVGTTPAGALLLLTAGKKPTDIGAWVTFPGGAKQLTTIIPGGKAIIETFKVHVPHLATPGDHTGGLVGAVSVPARNKAGVAVLENYRIAVPLELRVSGKLAAAVQVKSISTGFSVPLNPFGTGAATISYTVANTGNVRQSVTPALTVNGPFGQKSVIHPKKLPMILPGDSVRVTEAVPGLYPAGPMTAHVTATPGWPPKTIPIAQLAPIAAGSASLFAVPWSLIGLILLLAAIGVGIWYLMRWRRRTHNAEIAAAAAKASEDTERRLRGSKRAAANGEAGSARPASVNGDAGSAKPVTANGAAETTEPASANAVGETAEQASATGDSESAEPETDPGPAAAGASTGTKDGRHD
jgi:hypothetical protein